MSHTVAFVTSQYSCDRIISAASHIAQSSGTNLVVLGILDREYSLNPQVIDYLFGLSKAAKGDMRLIFSEDKMEVMRSIVEQEENTVIITGMPSNNKSVLYDLWKNFPDKAFFTIDMDGAAIEVATVARAKVV